MNVYKYRTKLLIDIRIDETICKDLFTYLSFRYSTEYFYLLKNKLKDVAHNKIK